MTGRVFLPNLTFVLLDHPKFAVTTQPLLELIWFPITSH